MPVITYNKLVRDRIPDIIQKEGNGCTVELLKDDRFLEMLDKKLDEELAEYHKDQTLEELADLWEVIRAVVVARGYTLEDLEQVRAEKEAKKGAFKHHILLQQVFVK